MSKIEIKNIDTNLLSGSGDKLRNVVGGFYSLEQMPGQEERGFKFAFDGPYAAGYEWTEAKWMEGLSVASGADFVTASATSIIPNYKFPIRILGDVDLVKEDSEWLALLKGGSWGTASYEGILTNNSYDSHNFIINTPYSLLDAKNIDSASYSTYSYYEIGCHYQDYYPDYENKMASRSSDLLIPNLYFLEMFRQNTTPGIEKDVFDKEVQNFVSMEGSSDPEQIMQDYLTSYLPPYIDHDNDPTEEGIYSDKTKNMRDYLTGTLIRENLSASTAEFIVERTSNLLFDRISMNNYSATQMQDQVLHRAPYYVSFDIPIESGDSMMSAIEENDYGKIFLSHLRQQFTGHQVGTRTYPTTAGTTFDQKISGSIVPITTTTNVTYRSADFLQLLLNSLNLSITDTPPDQYYMQPLTAEVQEMRNANGAYRYAHSLPAFKMFNATIKEMYSNPLECVADGSTGKFQTFLKMAQTVVDAEALAYRINKVSSSPTAPVETQTTAQDIFFLNTAHGGVLNYYDSQVRYGATYNYEIFAYVLVRGYNYKYSDLRGTRLIGTPYGFEAIGDLAAGAYLTPDVGAYESQYCLEFYDLTTGAPAEQLFYSADENILMSENPYATNAQIISPHRYLSELYISIEPSWKIMEVSMGTKQVTILDHLSPSVDVTPYQRMDDSQIIGFHLVQEAHSPSVFPTLLTEADQTYKDDYLRSYNLLSGEKVRQSSVSRANFVEVYRIDKKPTSIIDFEGALVENKDLTIKGYKHSKTNCFYEEMIKTNKKYYYLFRFVNEHGIPGFLSPIYVAELVDDGGYKYAKFDVIHETEFDQQNDLEVSQPIKKLLHLIPNAQHVLLDDSQVDYSQDAKSQLDSLQVGTGVERTIWNQPFKIRLTSRKTGKKIDLNITYRIREGA